MYLTTRSFISMRRSRFGSLRISMRRLLRESVTGLLAELIVLINLGIKFLGIASSNIGMKRTVF